MFDPHEYQLLDFGQGEKLEQFGDIRVCRETPSVADTSHGIDSSTAKPDLTFVRAGAASGRWSGNDRHHWQIAHGAKRFELRPTPAGQLGIFPEQATNWQWIEAFGQQLAGLKALNLFGYTGGTTMALALAGAHVTHVDAARNVVNWARTNAASSGLRDHSIRWISEDAVRFVKREIQRGNSYDIVVADPPSFGRGPAKEIWKMDRDLEELLDDLAVLTKKSPSMILFSSHTPGFDAQRLSRMISTAWNLPNRSMQPIEMKLSTNAGRNLPAGHAVRWSSLRHSRSSVHST